MIINGSIYNTVTISVYNKKEVKIMENSNKTPVLKLKLLSILPAVAIGFLILSIIFMLVSPDGDGVLFAPVLFGGLLIISILTIGLVGGLKESKGMFLVGTSLTLWLSNFALLYISVLASEKEYSLALYSNDKIVTLVFSFYSIITVLAILIGVAGLIHGFSKKKNKNIGTLLFVTSLLAEIFLFGHLAATLAAFAHGQADGTIITYTILFEIALMIIIGANIYIGFIAMNDKTEVNTLSDAKAFLTTQPDQDDLKVSRIRKYEQLLKEGLITQEEFEKKKTDILKS